MIDNFVEWEKKNNLLIGLKKISNNIDEIDSKKIEEYKSHKTALENSNIKYGGGLIFTYNRMHNDVPLKEEIFGKNFLQCYMYALDSKIKELQKEFDEL